MADRKVLIVDKETGEVIEERSKYGPFRRTLAFLVMVIEFWVFGFIVELVFRFLSWCFTQLSTLNGVFQVIIYLVLGSTIIGIALAPMFYGIPAMVSSSEGIAPSRNGARYIVFAVINGLFCAVIVVLYFVTSHRFSLVYTYLIIAAIIIGVVGKHVSKED